MSQAIFGTLLKLFVTRNSNATGHCVFFWPRNDRNGAERVTAQIPEVSHWWPPGSMRLTNVNCSVFTVDKIGIGSQHFKDFWLSLKTGSSGHAGSSFPTTVTKREQKGM